MIVHLIGLYFVISFAACGLLCLIGWRSSR